MAETAAPTKTRHVLGDMVYWVDHNLKKVFHEEKVSHPAELNAKGPDGNPLYPDGVKFRETGGSYDEFQAALSKGQAAIPTELPSGIEGVPAGRANTNKEGPTATAKGSKSE